MKKVFLSFYVGILGVATYAASVRVTHELSKKTSLKIIAKFSDGHERSWPLASKQSVLIDFAPPQKLVELRWTEFMKNGAPLLIQKTYMIDSLGVAGQALGFITLYDDGTYDLIPGKNNQQAALIS